MKPSSANFITHLIENNLLVHRSLLHLLRNPLRGSRSHLPRSSRRSSLWSPSWWSSFAPTWTSSSTLSRESATASCTSRPSPPTNLYRPKTVDVLKNVDISPCQTLTTLSVRLLFHNVRRYQSTTRNRFVLLTLNFRRPRRNGPREAIVQGNGGGNRDTN